MKNESKNYKLASIFDGDDKRSINAIFSQIQTALRAMLERRATFKAQLIYDEPCNAEDLEYVAENAENLVMEIDAMKEKLDTLKLSAQILAEIALEK